MAELSRGELLAWVNDLTSLNLSKVESLGTGSAHCLIINSIYGDIPLQKINFKAIHEYEYVQNFKVLQEAFVRHRIDRTVPVDRLIKLKFQDNLEFLQWIKKYWDAHFEGGSGVKSVSSASVPIANVPNSTVSASSNASHKISRSSSMKVTGSSAASIPNSAIPNTNHSPPTNTNANTNTNTASSQAQSNFQLAALTKTITELKLSVDEMEKERDFYFNKLRDIEILTQKINDPAIAESLFFKQITEILYTTEDGFEIPQDSNNKMDSSVSVLASN